MTLLIHVQAVLSLLAGFSFLSGFKSNRMESPQLPFKNPRVLCVHKAGAERRQASMHVRCSHLQKSSEIKNTEVEKPFAVK